MTLSFPVSVEVQPVSVMTSAPDTGLSADQLAQMLTDKVVYVGPDVPPVIAEQARAFRDRILLISRYYMAQMARSERTTMIGQLEQAGESRAAEILRKL